MPEFNASAMAQLEGMGFPTIRCQKALLATQNGDADAAMEWLFAHMEDPGMSSWTNTKARLIVYGSRYRRTTTTSLGWLSRRCF